jgi:hypothetical protein
LSANDPEYSYDSVVGSLVGITHAFCAIGLALGKKEASPWMFGDEFIGDMDGLCIGAVARKACGIHHVPTPAVAWPERT